MNEEKIIRREFIKRALTGATVLAALLLARILCKESLRRACQQLYQERFDGCHLFQDCGR
ncbi:hypothetical protein ES705_21204 [subsurface metagenome]